MSSWTLRLLRQLNSVVKQAGLTKLFSQPIRRWTLSKKHAGNFEAAFTANRGLVPWGFLRASVVARDVATDAARDYRLADGSRPAEWVREQLEERYTDEGGAPLSLPELEAGLAQAYRFVAGLFDGGGESIEGLKLGEARAYSVRIEDTLRRALSPQLAAFIADARAGHAARRVAPRLELQPDDGAGASANGTPPVSVTVLALREEFGSINTADKEFFGRWDEREVLHSLKEGFGPEFSHVAEFEGGGPRRLVAEVRFDSVEKFSFEGPGTEPPGLVAKEDVQVDPGDPNHAQQGADLLERLKASGVKIDEPEFRTATHYFTFERNLDGKTLSLMGDWSLRNINDLLLVE